MRRNNCCADLFCAAGERAVEERREHRPMVLLVLAIFIAFFAILPRYIFNIGSSLDEHVTALVVGRDSRGEGVVSLDRSIQVDATSSGVKDLHDFPHLAPFFFQPVALNKAGVASLSAVPGIGPKLAARIIELRRKKGGFSAVRELLEVAGIGPKKFAVLRKNFRI